MSTENQRFFRRSAVFILLTMQTLADGKINNINVIADRVELTVNTTLGEIYQVQCSYDLASGKWTDIGASFLAEAEATIRTFTEGAPCCYFRVVKVSDSSIEPPPPPFPPPPLPLS